jgi:hypothetical protein
MFPFQWKKEITTWWQNIYMHVSLDRSHDCTYSYAYKYCSIVWLASLPLCVPITTYVVRADRNRIGRPTKTCTRVYYALSESTICKLKACSPVCLSPYFFNQRTVFFSHNKSANSTFSHVFSAKRTRRLDSSKQRLYNCQLNCYFSTPSVPEKMSF